MRYKFSSNNSLNEFETIDTTRSVYLSFACEPQVNAFSQKFKGSQYGSTTETFKEVLSKMVQSGEILSDGEYFLLKGQGYPPRNRSELPNQERNPDLVSDQELLETQKALGAPATDASIWRALGYSRVTAANW